MQKTLFILGCLLCGASAVSAQKKPLDHSVYNDWKSINAPTLSPRAGVLTYEVNPQEGDGRLVVRLTSSGRELTIARGYSATVTPDERYAVCLVKPFFQDTRQARIKKKKGDDLPQDSIAIINLSDLSVVKYPSVASYRMGKEATEAVAFISNDTTLTTKADRKAKKAGKPLLVYHLRTAVMDTLRQVDAYDFDHAGRQLAVTTKDAKKKAAVKLYDVAARSTRTLSDDHPFYTLPAFDEEGTQLLYLASADTVESGSKHCELFRYRLTEADPERLIDRNYSRNLPAGWGLTENSAPYFSKDGTRIFAGVAELRAPKDTTLVDFETAGLDLWHYTEPQLQPQQLANLQRTLKATSPAVYHDGQLVPLTTSPYDRVQLISKGNAPQAYSVDRTAHMVETQWDMQIPSVLSLVDLTTGRRTPVGTRRYGTVTASPAGKYLLWYDYPERNWYLYNIGEGTTRCLTDGIPTRFWEEENDTPSYPSACGVAAWTANDRDVLLYDNRDIWKIPTDPSAA
ncbi:MAG: hypothetical protein LBL78_05810, partial [Prevotellaceae bacterium]|nr:hypothetical protein [Prevotellaceae bacterium]